MLQTFFFLNIENHLLENMWFELCCFFISSGHGAQERKGICKIEVATITIWVANVI